jgi:hypothetical protein
VFNVLVYAQEAADVPAGEYCEWADIDSLPIEAGKSQRVELRSFSTVYGISLVHGAVIRLVFVSGSTNLGTNWCRVGSSNRTVTQYE